MTQSKLPIAGHAVQSLHEWLKELGKIVDWDDEQRSYWLLRVTLQTLRDWLDVNEASQLGAQLPILIRGIYYEGWRPARTPVTARGKQDFLAHIEEAFKADPINNTGDAVTCVFKLLNRRISKGEIQQVRMRLPGALRELWPEET